ncbi:hypothetical protein B0H14DRAFT_3167369 [Mycena olivaceomarginata]|nr:hypothetical protein B0H14DRAFT_3167369 [Mycena olivaceomarginata]
MFHAVSIGFLPALPIVLLDETNTVKLGDFGLAAVLDGGSFGKTFVGPGMRPSAARLLKHERIRFATERQTFLMRKSKLGERELAFQDAIRNKYAEIYSLCQREMELIQALNKLKEDKDAEIQSLNWKIHHYQRREAEMYEIIQSKQKETKDAFLRRETELLEALEQRDEVMRFTRGRLEALVKCSRSAELEDYKTARSLLEEVTDILYPQAQLLNPEGPEIAANVAQLLEVANPEFLPYCDAIGTQPNHTQSPPKSQPTPAGRPSLVVNNLPGHLTQ